MKTTSVAAVVGHPMGGPGGDVDGLPGRQGVHGAVEGHLRLSRHEEPVLGPLGVALVAQPLARAHHDALDLVVGARRRSGRCRCPRGALRTLHRSSCLPGGRRLHRRLHAARSAARTALRKSMARVMGPTPPSRGVIHPATSATSSSTSESSFLPAQLVPAPTTAAPGLIMSRVTRPARPAAATTTSAVRTMAARSSTPVCTTVTAALQPGRLDGQEERERATDGQATPDDHHVATFHRDIVGMAGARQFPRVCRAAGPGPP